MQALAIARSRAPSARRGVGYSKRACSVASAAARSADRASASPRCTMASPAAASPGVPDTQSRSPTRPPLRRRPSPCGTKPITCTPSVSGPRVVSPPTRATSCIRANAPRPALNSASQPSSTDGKVNDSSAQAGVAPMAAMSLRLTASARWPIDRGAEALGKCTPSTKVSLTATRSKPGGGRRIAPSSPTPTGTSPRLAPAARK